MGALTNLPAPVEKIVSEFLKKLSSITPGFVEGMYLTGSVSLNDFQPTKSDIDFLVLCKQLPDKNTIPKLITIHKSLDKENRLIKLNGSYLPLESISATEPEKSAAITYLNGHLKNGSFEMGEIVLSELNDNAITVAGPIAQSLPIAIDKRQLREFLHRNINSYWQNWINSHSKNLHRKTLLILFPRLTEWSILGVARQYYTLKTGKIGSKTEAGNYCVEHLPSNFHSIIRKAIEIRKQNRIYPILKSYGINPSLSRQKQTVACVNYIIAQFNQTFFNAHRPFCREGS